MATSALVTEPENSGCLQVRPSPDDTYLYFSSVSDYLQHLITHGVCYAGAILEPVGPAASQLQQVIKSPPIQGPSITREPSNSKISASEGFTVHSAVLSGRTSIVKTVIKQCSPTALDCPDEQGFTPLLYTALTGAHDMAATLIKAGASPDTPHTTTGVTPLSLACLHGHTDLVKLLLRHKSSLSGDCNGCSPLHSAVWGGSGKAVKALVSHSPSLVERRDSGGRSALHLAAARGDVEMCQLLAKKGCNFEDTDSFGRTALHWAILSCQLSCVERLLATGTLCNQPDSNGATPAHYAAMNGQCDLLKALSDKGGSTDVRDSNNHSLLFWACACGHVDTVRQLIKLTNRGTSSSSEDVKDEMVEIPPEEGGQCLRVACSVGSLDVCQLLLQTTPTLAKVPYEGGRTALHEASYHGHTDCLDEILEAGASPDSATLSDNRTSLHVASERGHCEVVASLLAAGANYTCSTHPQGERPIHLAAQKGHTSIVIELLRRGCAPDIRRDNDGRTALLLAAESGHMNCCRLLVERGADPSISDTTIQSLTALDLAMAGGHREVADYLISIGAPSGGGIFHRAALTIQAVWRLHRYRRRQRSRREWSASVIQRAVRRWIGRRGAGRVRRVRERNRHRAAATIQRSWRQFIEGRRRYEASCARLRARIQQEHQATSLLLSELQAQSHCIRLPPPTSPRAHPHSSHKPQATPGYLLQVSAPLASSPSFPLSPTHHLKPLVPSTRPRRPLLRPSHPKHPPPPSQTSPSPSHTPQPHPLPVEDEEEIVKLPTIPPKPLVTSITATSSLTVRRRRSNEAKLRREVVERAVVGTTDSRTSVAIESERDTLPVIAGVGSSERGMVASGDGKIEGMNTNEQELPPLPPTPSLVSPSPHPHPTPLPLQSPVEIEAHSLTPSPPQERGPNQPKSSRKTPGRESENGLRTLGSPPRHYLRQTMFRGAVLGQMRREEEEEEVDGRLLGPIQRYDRLNRVLGLLQQVREGEGQGVELRDLRQHIQSALDEAVRLRADTESLEHTAKARLAQRTAAAESTN